MTALVLICSLVLAPEPNNLAQPLTASSRIVIPVAGNTEGALGTHYRSDITILNFRQSVQRVRLDWLPQAGGTQIDPVFIDINAVSGSRYEDFVRQVLNVSGLGSIVVTGVTQAGIHDPGALLWISSRIWTPQPETNGTTSQSLMTIPFDSVNTTVASIFGLRRSNQYRLNVGIVNLDPARERFVGGAAGVAFVGRTQPGRGGFQDQAAYTFGMAEGRVEREAAAHRVADEHGPVDADRVEHADERARRAVHRVRLRGQAHRRAVPGQVDEHAAGVATEALRDLLPVRPRAHEAVQQHAVRQRDCGCPACSSFPFDPVVQHGLQDRLLRFRAASSRRSPLEGHLRRRVPAPAASGVAVRTRVPRSATAVKSLAWVASFPTIPRIP